MKNDREPTYSMEYGNSDNIEESFEDDASIEELGILDESVILEDISEIQDKYGNDDIVPLFFTTTFTNSAFGNVIRTVMKDHYTHASIGFDSDLESLYSFNVFPDNLRGGISYENISGYLNVFDDTEIYVGMILLNHDEYEKVREYINDFIKNQKSTRYAFSNVLHFLTNKESSKKKEHEMVCSEFVDSVLKILNLDISGKSSSLTRPQDLRNTKNTRVYTVYEGLAKNYNKHRTNRIVAQLKNRIRKGYRRDLITEGAIDTTREFVNLQSVKIKIKKIIQMHVKLNTFGHGVPGSNGELYEPSGNGWSRVYRYLSPEEFLQYKGGVCWDYAQFQYVTLLELGYSVINFFVELLGTDDNHTFTVVKVNGMYIYIESSYKKLQGIYVAKHIATIFNLVISNMVEKYNGKKMKYQIRMYHGYDNYGCDVYTFYKFMDSQKLVAKGELSSDDNLKLEFKQIYESGENVDDE